MPTDSSARVQDLYEAFSAGDWRRVLGAFTEDHGLVVRPLECFGDDDRVVAVEHIGDTEMLTRALGPVAPVA